MVKISVDTTPAVARLTHDHLDKKKGNLEFTYGGFVRYWSAQLFADNVDELGLSIEYFDERPETKFRLYDDDSILYYSGWLKDDENAMVQQFVLAWAMADSGCTTIKILNADNEWEQVIG